MDRQSFDKQIEGTSESIMKILAALDGVDPRGASVCMQMMNSMQLISKYQAQLLAKTGLPASQAGCLLLIGVFEGLSQRELAKKLGIASSSSTVMLQRMQKAGLIERRPDETDQRILRVFLSAHGHSNLADVKRAFADFINNTIGSISERGMQAILIVIEELTDSVNSARTSIKDARQDGSKKLRSDH